MIAVQMPMSTTDTTNGDTRRPNKAMVSPAVTTVTAACTVNMVATVTRAYRTRAQVPWRR